MFQTTPEKGKPALKAQQSGMIGGPKNIKKFARGAERKAEDRSEVQIPQGSDPSDERL
jgi:hypothetical protein